MRIGPALSYFGSKWRAAKHYPDPISFHDLRRTFNSLLLESGANHVLVQALTGHSTDRMTLHYAHVSDDARRAVVVPIAQAFRGSRRRVASSILAAPILKS